MSAAKGLLACLVVAGWCSIGCAAADPDPVAGRKAREEFRRSGFHWMSPLEYKQMDRENNTRPYMFSFLSSRCPLCRGLLEHFATKEEPMWLSSLSSQFNAVLIWDAHGDELIEREYADTGNYVPRTVFADPDGKMRKELQSKNAGPENPYYYLPRELLWQMVSLLQGYNLGTASKPTDLWQDWPS